MIVSNIERRPFMVAHPYEDRSQRADEGDRAITEHLVAIPRRRFPELARQHFADRVGVAHREGVEGVRGRCHGVGGLVAEEHDENSYSGYRFPPEIIHQAIWLYLRFTLSLRDVEDLLAERGMNFVRNNPTLGELTSGRSSLQRNCASAVPDRIRSGILTRSI